MCSSITKFEFFLTAHMVQIHDMKWVAFAAIHTRNIFRFAHQVTISLPPQLAMDAVTLAAPRGSTASPRGTIVSRKIING